MSDFGDDDDFGDFEDAEFSQAPPSTAASTQLVSPTEAPSSASSLQKQTDILDLNPSQFLDLAYKTMHKKQPLPSDDASFFISSLKTLKTLSSQYEQYNNKNSPHDFFSVWKGSDCESRIISRLTTRTSSSDPSSAAAQSAAVASYKMPVASILKQASSRASSVGEEVRSAPPPPPPSQPTTTATSNGNDLVSPMASLHVHGEGFDPGLLAERTAHDASPGEDVLHHIDNHHLPMDSGDDDGYINPFLSPVHEEHHEKQQTTHLAMLDGFVEVECAGIDSIHTTTASLHSSNEFDEDFTDNKSNITAAAAETAEKTQEEVDGDRTDGGILDVPVANEVRDFAVQSGFVVNNPFGENTVHGGDEFVDNLFENEVPGGQHTGFNPFEDHHGALGESEGVTIIKDDTSFNPFLSPSSEPTAASLHGQELPEQPTKGDDDDFGDFSDFT